MSLDIDDRAALPEPDPEAPSARLGRTVAIEWIQSREPEGGWTDLEGFARAGPDLHFGRSPDPRR